VLIEEDEGLQEEEPRRKEPAFLLYLSAETDLFHCLDSGVRMDLKPKQRGIIRFRIEERNSC